MGGGSAYSHPVLYRWGRLRAPFFGLQWTARSERIRCGVPSGSCRGTPCLLLPRFGGAFSLRAGQAAPGGKDPGRVLEARIRGPRLAPGAPRGRAALGIIPREQPARGRRRASPMRYFGLAGMGMELSRPVPWPYPGQSRRVTRPLKIVHFAGFMAREWRRSEAFKYGFRPSNSAWRSIERRHFQRLRSFRRNTTAKISRSSA